jgi:DNA repair protein RecO (recombination protein O)
MMHYTVDGLVIREVCVGENDKMLTILTPDRGRIGVMAKGSRSLKSQVLSTAQLYTYGNYEIYEKNDYKWLRSGSVIEGFFGLRNDIELISLAAYLSDIAWELSGEDVPSVEMLRMTLNAFYALSNGIKSQEIVKGVYELRAAGFSGFMPDLSGCRYCKKDSSERFYLDVMNGALVCSDCIFRRSTKERSAGVYEEGEERVVLLPMSQSVLAATRYALFSPPERMFSFNLDGGEEISMFSRLAEEYLLHHLERGFGSLDFYKSLKSLPTKK